MTDTFSTPAEHAFEHEEIEMLAGPSTMGDATEELSVEEAFEVNDTIKRIRDGGYKTVSCPFRCLRLQAIQGFGTNHLDWSAVPRRTFASLGEGLSSYPEGYRRYRCPGLRPRR